MVLHSRYPQASTLAVARLPPAIPLIVVIVADSMCAPANDSTLHKNDMTSRSPTRVDDCEHIETYVESVGLLYYKDLKQRLMKQSVLRVLRIHEGSRAMRALELNHKWRFLLKRSSWTIWISGSDSILKSKTNTYGTFYEFYSILKYMHVIKGINEDVTIPIGDQGCSNLLSLSSVGNCRRHIISQPIITPAANLWKFQFVQCSNKKKTPVTKAKQNKKLQIWIVMGQF
ncbi:hypothetical protein CTI12_AA297010 [Artemisia annua]|uniref:Uncharacterized protein n=1 Tax=Artemisia annua TaxID=35608 RepID=A0A2U1N7Y2_ARTAN|nr:hypothetical protein CTI12_AA297010 [Artemisia annua]